MQLETLKVFCDVVETKSFSKAAVLNFISQSAVSQQMRALEEKYDHRLVERGKRNLAPTLAGQVLYEVAKDVLTRLDSMEQRLQRLSKSVTGEVHVATIYSVGMHGLHSYVTEFMKQYPSARVRMEYARANRVYEAVLGNVADIGIVAYPARRSGIEILPFTEDELVIVCHPKHPFAKQESVRTKQMEGQDFVGFERDIPTRRAIDRILREADTRVNMVMEFDNIDTIKQAVEIGGGISILPRVSVEQEADLGTLAVAEFAGVQHRRSLGLLIKRGRDIPTAMQRLLDVFTKAS